MNKNYEIKNMNDKTSIFEEKLEKFKNIFSSSEELKNNFPDFFDLDGELEIEKMKQFLSEYETEYSEGFGLYWKGKNEAKKESEKEIEKYFISDRERSKNFDETKNIIIEGDNLEILKLLKKSYKEKIKCIYIDPPYNTGKDFLYKDNFSKGEELKKEDGRKHTKWLSFIYPRLKLARDLLKDDGVIFISIDDNEVAHLKLICDEIFGGENFIGSIIRKTKSTTNDKKTGFNTQHEECLLYGKNSTKIKLNGEKKDFHKYTNPDNDQNGNWCSGDPSAKSGNEKNNYFLVKNPITGKIDYPPKNRFWAFSENTIGKHIESGKLKFKKKDKENERGFIWKSYQKEKDTNKPINSLFSATNEYMNQVATKYVNDILPEGVSFENTKPINFIKKLIECSNNPNDIILDFFAGSGTTGEAIMKLNSKDGGNRRFVLVQLKEEITKTTNNIIDKITIPRIRISGEKYYPNIDNGFKVFKLSEKEEIQGGQQSLDFSSNEEIFYRIATFHGYGLNYKIQKIEDCEIFIMNGEFDDKKALIILQKIQNENFAKLEKIQNEHKNFNEIFLQHPQFVVNQNLCQLFDIDLKDIRNKLFEIPNR